MSAEQDTTKAATAAPATAPVAEKPVVDTPASETTTEVTAGVANLTVTETSLTKFAARLPEILKAVAHTEMWGVELGNPAEHVPTKVVLQKFLRANNDDVAAAEKQLTAALEWRKEIQPTALVKAFYDEAKFGGLGYVTVHKDDAGKETVITWNIYGAVKSFKTTFGNLDEFIKWRTALMELGVQKLNLGAVTEPIPEDGTDPYQMIQVHDYLSVSFLRMDPHVKTASSKTIELFSTVYPELLSQKYFVNVFVIMGWMYAAMKPFLAPATLKKFHPMSSGTTLATELPGIVSSLPKEYGGQGVGVKEQGLAVQLEAAKKEEIPLNVGDAPIAAVTDTKAEDTKTEDTKTEEIKAADVQPAEKPVEKPVMESAEVKPVEVKEDISEQKVITEKAITEEIKPEEKPAEEKPAAEVKAA